MAASCAEARLAELLAAPFLKPGQSRSPLSFRLLPEGGMVVISADGRKLWFTLEEVNAARAQLDLPLIKAKKPANPPLTTEFNPNISSRPTGGSRDGLSEMIVLPPDLKHLEAKAHDKTHRA